MNILRVITCTDIKKGGPIEGIRQITPVLAGMGHSTEIASLDDPASPWLRDHPFSVHALGPGSGSYNYSPKFVPWLRENAGRFDVVIVHGVWQYTSFGARKAMRDIGKPYFIYTHGMLDPWFKRAYPLKHVKKTLYWPLGEFPVLRDAEAVLFTSQEEQRLASGSFLPYRCNEVVVSYGTSRPADDTLECREEFLRAFPSLRDKRIVMFLSRIHEKKGCDNLIAAFADLCRDTPDLRLVMAGPDQTGWTTSLQAKAHSLGIDERITWTGMLTGRLKSGAFASAEVFALPSHQENFGIAVAEALAHGVPVLITDKVNIWREIEGDGAGLVSADTLDGAKETLHKWLSFSGAERTRMAESAKCCFEKHFEINAATTSLLRVIGHSSGIRRVRHDLSQAQPGL